MNDLPQDGGPPVPWDRVRNRPPLNAGITAAGAILVGMFLFTRAGYLILAGSFGVLHDPVGTLVHVVERDLDHSVAIDGSGAWERGIYRAIGYDADSWCDSYDDAFDRLHEHLLDFPEFHPQSDVDRASAHHAILRAEHFAGEGMAEVLERIEDRATGAEFSAFMTTLYGSNAPPVESSPALPALIGESGAGDTWWRDSIEARWAERQGRPAVGDASRQRIASRGRALLLRSRWVLAPYLAVLVLGGCVALWHVRRLSRPIQVSRGFTVAPWSFRVGGHVLIQCVAITFLAGMAVSAVAEGVLMPMGSLLAGLPVLFLMHRVLFAPDGSTPFHGFGMDPTSLSVPRLLLFALGLSALDQGGCLVIRLVTDWAGLEYLVEEGLDEGLLFGSWTTVTLTLVDGVVSAPLFEELLFRGLLYVTLRTRLRPVAAALVSGGLFAMVHLYSVGGFLEVFWTGCVFALGYEKCRSLWPCILAHGFNNLIVFGWLLAAYR